MVLALVPCWVVVFSLPHGSVVLPACPLCGLSSKVSWGLPTSELPPELHSKAQLLTPLWLLCVPPTGDNIMQPSLKGLVWLQCCFWWALQMILHQSWTTGRQKAIGKCGSRKHYIGLIGPWAELWDSALLCPSAYRHCTNKFICAVGVSTCPNFKARSKSLCFLIRSLQDVQIHRSY